MQADMTEGQVRDTLRRFQEGYTTRDLSRLDEFMQLFAQEGGPELIGIGASVRGENEWFEGPAAIREIIESDWTYWGDVWIDVGSFTPSTGPCRWIEAWRASRVADAKRLLQ